MDTKKLSSLIIAHIQQIGLFLWQSGIEIYCLNDTPGKSIKTLIDTFLQTNKISLYYDDMWWKGAITGELLFYLLPLEPGNYRFLYYHKDCFEYKLDSFTGELELVIIKVSGKVHEISKTSFKTWDDETRYPDKNPDKVVFNKYNFIPCVVVQNKPCIGNRGQNEFDFLKDKIDAYDELVKAVSSNIEITGYPILGTSLSKNEVTERTMFYNGGVADAYGYGSFYKLKDSGNKPKRIVTGLEPDDILKFVNPASFETSILAWINDIEAGLRYSLGGVPARLPLGDSLVNEKDINYKYAPAISTALKRAESYVTYGLVSLVRLFLRMYYQDSIIPEVTLPIDLISLEWRYKGNVFQPTALDRLNKSIVARNLIRLGVNLHDSMKHIFPDLSSDEIESMLKDGFAYEYLNGMGQVASRYPSDEYSEVYSQTEKLILDEIKRANNE